MKQFKKILQAMLAIAIASNLYGYSNIYAKDNDDRTVLIAGSDYQGGSDAGSASNVKKILNAMKEDGITSPDGLIWPGDYNIGHVDATTSNTSIQSLKTTVSTIYPTLNNTNIVLSAGNHETNMADGIDVWTTGPHEFDTYTVYVINEDDFPWESNSWNDNDFEASYYEATVQNTATNLMNYLNTQIQNGNTKPIFVLCHVPLHFTNRTNSLGDGEYASYLFNVLNKAGAAGLNLFFLYGHNHGGGAEDYHGGGAVCYKKGDTIYIPNTGCIKGGNYSEPKWTARQINFTYLNAGYTGYLQSASGVCSHLTMTAYLFDETSIEIRRYSSDGLHDLKGPGSNSNDTPNVSLTNTYEGTQTIKLSNVNKSMLIDNYYANTNLDGTWPEDLDFSVKSISLNTEAITLDENESYQLISTIQPDTARNKNVTWTCDNDEILTIDQSGLVQTKTNLTKSGSAIVTATTEDGNLQATCTVTVIAEVDKIHIQSIDSPDSIDLLLGDETPFNITITPNDASNKTCIYSSEDESIVSIDENGILHANSLGQTVVYAITKDGNYTTSSTINVLPVRVSSLSFIEKEKTMITGNEESLAISLFPENATNQTVIWESSDTQIATVDQSGNVLAKSVGTVTITATSEDGNYSDTCTLTVNPITVKNIEIDQTLLSLIVGQSETLHITFNPENAANQSIRWTSSNPEVATVENGTVQALQEGETTITATSVDGNRKAKCTVYVSNQEVKPSSIQIDFEELIIPMNQEFKLHATLLPNNTTVRDISWKCYWQADSDYLKEGIFKGTGITYGNATTLYANTKNGIQADANIIVESESICQWYIKDNTLFVEQGDVSNSVPWSKYTDRIDRIVFSKEIEKITKNTIKGCENAEIICLNPFVDVELDALNSAAVVYAYKDLQITNQIYLDDSLFFEEETLNLEMNELSTIHLHIPYEYIDLEQTWQYDEIVSIENRTITAISPGQTTLFLTIDEETAECIINVSAPQIETITFEQTEYTLNIGEEIQLTPAISPIEADSSNLQWSSDNPNVVTVKNGLIHALTSGYATITVCDANNQSASVIVYVNKAPENETLLGYSLSASDLVGINYFMSIPESISEQDPVMKYKNQTIRPVVENGAYKFTILVNAKEMTDQIDAVFTYGDIEHTYSYSVQEYVEYLSSHDYNEKDKSIAQAMLSYGYYAQDYFEYNLDNERTMGTVPLTQISESYEIENTPSSFIGARLILESTTGIKLYFTSGEIFTINGIEQQSTIEDGYKVIAIKHITPKEMNSSYLINVDGEEFNYSIFNFGYISQYLDKPTLSNLMQSMYSYYLSTLDENVQENINDDADNSQTETTEEEQEEIVEDFESIEKPSSELVLESQILTDDQYHDLINDLIENFELDLIEINEETINEINHFFNEIETIDFDDENESTVHRLLKKTYEYLLENDIDIEQFQNQYLKDDCKLIQELNNKINIENEK